MKPPTSESVTPMSKLAERIRKATHPEPAHLGFAAPAARQKSASLLVVARLSAGDAGKAADAVKKGADAVIVDGLEAGKAKDVAGKADGAALGARLAKANRSDVAGLRDAGVDFVVVDPGSAMAEVLLEEKVGFVFEQGGDVEDTGLRLLGEMGLDAIVIPAPVEPLTVRDLLGLRRLASLTRTPLLAGVRPEAEAGFLQALRDSGVVGVIVDGSGLGKLDGLKSRIEALPVRGRRKEEHAEATLPAKAASGEDDDEDDD